MLPRNLQNNIALLLVIKLKVTKKVKTPCNPSTISDRNQHHIGLKPSMSTLKDSTHSVLWERGGLALVGENDKQKAKGHQPLSTIYIEVVEHEDKTCVT